MIDPSQMSPGGAPGGGAPMIGPESLLALLAGAAIGQMAGSPGAAPAAGAPGQTGGGASSQQPQGQAKGEATAVGQTSMNDLLPQLLQALAGGGPPGAAGGGKGGSQPAQGAQGAAPAQEPMALSVLRMLGMTRPGGATG